MVTLLKRTLGEHITIKLEEGAGLWPVVIDAAQLDAAIVNLSVNARDAMADGGTLTIETSNVRVDEHVLTMYPALETGDYVVVSVTDTGTGMPPEVIAHVFEPFFTTKGPSKGTGLGLAMVYGFVKQSGGHVTVYSEVGTGTTFRLYLPRATSTDVAEAPAQALVEVPSTRQTECILVVEDNQSVRKLVARQLADLGYRVIVAGNADEGLAILESDALVDLVFSDVVMPGKLNGIKFAAEIAKRWPNIRVLLTSGFPEAALNNSGNTQHVSILAKPYRAEELAQAIRKLVATQPE
jgi:CheY-like chemotaxis protein